MTGRILVLLRHAKAEPSNGVPDFERQLTKRGHADAVAAGQWLSKQGFLPDLVVCSPAARTRQSWQGVAAGLAVAPDAVRPDVRFELDLYHGGRTELVDLIQAVPDAVGTLLVVGHNPTVSDVSLLLHRDDALDPAGLRTCGLAVHRLADTWRTCEPGTTELIEQHTARA